MDTLRQELDKLGNLYTITGRDWILEIHHVLTEPVCPSVSVYPEDIRTSRWRYDCDSIEEGVRRVVAHVYRDIYGDNSLHDVLAEHAAPYTNPDDRTGKLMKLIEKWRAKAKEAPPPPETLE